MLDISERAELVSIGDFNVSVVVLAKDYNKVLHRLVQGFFKTRRLQVVPTVDAGDSEVQVYVYNVFSVHPASPTGATKHGLLTK